MISRRRLLEWASSAVAFRLAQQSRGGDGHLSVKLRAPRQTATLGEHALGLGSNSGRDGLLIVPKSYRPDVPAPLAVILHGAGGSARRVLSFFGVADELGVIVLAPESRGGTWDAIRGSFGPDIEFLDRTLSLTFDRCAVDRNRVAIGSTSRRIVPLLEKSGYAVTYREFDGPHTVPPPIAREAFTWFTGEKPRVQ